MRGGRPTAHGGRSGPLPAVSAPVPLMAWCFAVAGAGGLTPTHSNLILIFQYAIVGAVAAGASHWHAENIDPRQRGVVAPFKEAPWPLSRSPTSPAPVGHERIGPRASAALANRYTTEKLADNAA